MRVLIQCIVLML